MKNKFYNTKRETTKIKLTEKEQNYYNNDLIETREVVRKHGEEIFFILQARGTGKREYFKRLKKERG